LSAETYIGDPFDNDGRESLTLAESLAAMKELERQVSALCVWQWQWCDLRLSVVERHPTYVVYDVEHRDEYVGNAIVMPCAATSERSPELECPAFFVSVVMIETGHKRSGRWHEGRSTHLCSARSFVPARLLV
jgi:hypothetical protein